MTRVPHLIGNAACGPCRILLLMLVLFPPAPSHGDPDSFTTWIDGLRADAQRLGVSHATLDAALADAAPIDRVLQLQEKQPESTMSWAEYGRRVVSDDRIVRGKRMLEQHGDLLAKVAEKYGVQPRFLVALWGVESDFGHHTGDMPAVSALATLAWRGRRGDYFRGELIELLRAVEAGYADPAHLQSSWAGALGQCQFMPSNFRRFGVDFDGDGRRDIWTSTGDVLASMARFLAHLGWQDDETWGRPVLLPAGFDTGLAGRDTRMRLTKWHELGILRLNGDALPTRDLWASLVLPDGASGDAFLVYDDFFTLMRWNNSYHFALSVGMLSDQL
ncbi:MAG: lytic murein transglycosylase [bacterium]|nr:lytic murein transglycosylase [bacterium]